MSEQKKPVNNRNQLNSLRRALQALAALNEVSVLSAQSLGKMIAIPRTNAYRILETLAAEGYVLKIPYSGEYRLTPKIAALSKGFDRDNWLLHTATPLLFSKTQNLGIPFLIATRDGDEMVVRLSTDRAASMAVWHFPPGYRTPIAYSATGHIMLALDAEDDRRATIDRCFSYTSAANRPLLCSPEFLVQKIEETSQQGFSHLVYDNTIEASVSVPLVVHGVVHAALLMHYLRRSAGEARVIGEFVPMLRKISAEITATITSMEIALRNSKTSMMNF